MFSCSSQPCILWWSILVWRSGLDQTQQLSSSSGEGSYSFVWKAEQLPPPAAADDAAESFCSEGHTGTSAGAEQGHWCKSSPSEGQAAPLWVLHAKQLHLSCTHPYKRCMLFLFIFFRANSYKGLKPHPRLIHILPLFPGSSTTSVSAEMLQRTHPATLCCLSDLSLTVLQWPHRKDISSLNKEEEFDVTKKDGLLWWKNKIKMIRALVSDSMQLSNEPLTPLERKWR